MLKKNIDIIGDKGDNNTTTQINNAVDAFYSLKQQYEEINKTQKNNIIFNKNLTKHEKKQALQKIIPKCINCKRIGGTIFSIKYDDEKLSRVLKSHCAVSPNPCGLDIHIETGHTEYIPDVIKNYNIEISNIKKDIIKNKNDTIFGYDDPNQIITNFEKLKEQLEIQTEIRNSYVEKLFNVVNNLEKKARIEEANIALKNTIETIKNLIRNPSDIDRQVRIKNVIDIYINELQPILNVIRTNLYMEEYVETISKKDDNTYKLIKNKVNIESLEENISIPQVISFVIGEKQKRKKEVSTRKTKRGGNIDVSEDDNDDMETEDDTSQNIEQNEELEEEEKSEIQDDNDSDEDVEQENTYKFDVDVDDDDDDVDDVDDDDTETQQEPLTIGEDTDITMEGDIINLD